MRPSNRIFRPFMVPLMAALAVLPAQAQNGKLPADARAKIDDAVAHFMAKSSAPGVAVAVVEDGQFAWAAGYGMADLENQVPVTPETLFRLGSVSKPLTAVAAMQLWEQGKLDLDAPIQKYCSAFPDKHALITTRELLGHLGGIRHYLHGEAGEAEVNNTTHFADPVAGGLSFFKNDALVHPPGTHYSYSTQGYTLVGCAVAAASGEPYADEVRLHVFVPAGMTATQVDDRFAVIPRRTRFYHLAEGRVVNAEFLDSSYKIPGGGWISSAGDMARFEEALLAGTLVKPATFALMTTPLKPSDGSADHYGLGFSIGSLDGAETVSHLGGQQGTSTAILLIPSRRAGIVVLINLDEAGAGELADEVARIVLSGK